MEWNPPKSPPKDQTLTTFLTRESKVSSCLKSRILIALQVLAFVLLASPFANADVLFEGYSKVLLDGAHVGYVVQRYDFNPKTKEFSTIYYLKTNAAAGGITESVKARSDAGMKPIAYQYTELSGNSVKTIDATFKNDTMTAIIKEGSKQQTIQKKIPKNAFLASFLGYMMLQGKEGIKKGIRYSYQAVAEEDAGLYNGEANISDEEVVSGINAFKVLNTFKGAQFVSWVTHKGEILATRSPVQKIATELVANVQEATAGQSLNSNNLSLLFGSVPRGQENVVARRSGTTAPAAPAATNPSAPAQPAPADSVDAAAAEQAELNAAPTGKDKSSPPSGKSPKLEGVPGGKGVMIKGAPPAANPSSKEKK